MADRGNGSPRIVPFPGIPDPAEARPSAASDTSGPTAADAALEELPPLAVIGAAQAAEDGTRPDGDDKKAGKRSARERLTSRKREAKPQKRRAGLVVGIVFLLLLLAVVAAAVSGFVWLRWYAHDDHADFQGTWYVSGSETPIEITADTIVLTDAVSYRYGLNTQDKTIEFTIGNMAGYGSYRFSLDRQELVIFDGRTTADAVLNADVRWLAQALLDEVTDERNDLTGGIRRNLTFLTREPLSDLDVLALNGAPSDASSSTSSSGSTGSGSSSGGEGSQPVWSAEQWLNEQEGAPSTIGGPDEADSIFDNINDLPADDASDANAPS